MLVILNNGKNVSACEQIVIAHELKTAKVSNLKKASDQVRNYIEKNDLSESCFTGGPVLDKSGKVAAIVSYDGRIWKIDEWCRSGHDHPTIKINTKLDAVEDDKLTTKDSKLFVMLDNGTFIYWVRKLVFNENFLGVKVNSLKSASKAILKYIDETNMGGSVYLGGLVFDSNGDIVAYISYNGRIWSIRDELAWDDKINADKFKIKINIGERKWTRKGN